MKETLVKQLEGSVDNDMLPVYDGLVFKLDLTKGFNYPTLEIQGKVGTKFGITNCGLVSTISGNSMNNPFTITNASSTSKPKPTNATKNEGIFTIEPYKNELASLRVVNCIDSPNTIEDIVNYTTVLESLGLIDSEVGGSLLSLAQRNSITMLCITNNKSLTDGNIRNLLNEMAKHRDNGTSLTLAISNGAAGAAGAFSDIPIAVQGTYFGNYATIYFTSDTTTYPKGWYQKSPGGTYYNSNDEQITV